MFGTPSNRGTSASLKKTKGVLAALSSAPRFQGCQVSALARTCKCDNFESRSAAMADILSVSRRTPSPLLPPSRRGFHTFLSSGGTHSAPLGK